MPNAAYIRIGDRYTGLLVFPDQYEESMSKNPVARQVPKPILEDLFQIFTSTLIALQESEEAHLTVNYRAESSRQSRMGACPPGGGTHAIAPDLLEPFTRQVLHRVRRHPWGKNSFWLNQCRGMRSANVTKLEDLPESPEAIFTQRFKMDILGYMVDWKNWYFDIGVELMLDHHVLMFRKDSFPLLMQKILTLPEADAHAVVHTAKFHWDSAALLNDAGGFRFTPARQDADRYGVHYVQGYSTEKHQIYSLGRDHSAAIVNFKDILNQGVDGYTKSLLTAWADTALARTNWNSRLEIRVRADRLTLSERLDFTTNEILRCFFMFPSRAWFRFKSIRLYALTDMLTFWHRCIDPGVKSHVDSLHLVFACIWSINALNSRPADKATDRALSDLVCPHRFNRAQQQWDPVRDHFGLHFLPGLVFHLNHNSGVGYLRGITLDQDALQLLAGSAVSLRDLRRILSKRRLPDAHIMVLHPDKRSSAQSNKIAPRKIIQPPANFINPFTMDEQGFTLKDGGSVDERLAQVFCQFQSDIVHKMPIRQSAVQTYERSDRDTVVQDHWHQVLHRSNVADVFSLCAFVPSSTLAEWTRVFNLCFSEDPRDATRNSQNWKDFVWPGEWMSLRADVEKDVWKAAAKDMFRVWCEKLAWVPRALGSRAWSTKKNDMKGGIRPHSDDNSYEGPCPIILLNPTLVPQPTFQPLQAVPVEDW